ncbi:MAG: class I mannose-6-phosphate isomerase, partial [Hyphomicrobiales bacterium]
RETIMAIEHACVRAVSKPWGSTDLRPWSEIEPDGAAIGELWFQRDDAKASEPALLLKLLFTKEPLSIQVHPDDACARSLGLERGKTEAWYVLSAAPGAGVAVGLKREVTKDELRASIADGSIAELVQWRPALKGDVVLVPAGTIHAIGAGLVLAEIQQRSDTTFRLFDHGRQRGLQVDDAMAAAHLGPAGARTVPKALGDGRTLLVADPYFVLERLEFAPDSHWELDAEGETWLLALEGDARIGPIELSIGEAVFVEADRAGMRIGPEGLTALLAYSGPEPVRDLMRQMARDEAGSSTPSIPRLPPIPAEPVDRPARAMEARS